MQLSLLDSDTTRVGDVAFERIGLDEYSWVDLARSYCVGLMNVMDDLLAQPGWKSGHRMMYGREVADPRRSRWFRGEQPDPHPFLAAVRNDLSERYAVRFGGVGLNHYRDGNDSVAWHGDRELRHPREALVAVLTMGAQRPFRIRPVGGGSSVDLSPASGDLIVMGGRSQIDWEHAVPKVRTPVGPRLSASWRWAPDGSHLDFERDSYWSQRSWRA